MRPYLLRTAAALAAFTLLLSLTAAAEPLKDKDDLLPPGGGFGPQQPGRVQPPKERDDAELPATGKANPDLASFDQVMKKVLHDNHVPGGTIAVCRDGQIVYARGFGYADLENKEAVAPDALFRLASVSKPITAVAVLQLVERGKLKLDDKVFDLLELKAPDGPKAKFDERWKKITVLHLMQHRGGWDRDKTFDPVFRSPMIVQEFKCEAPATADDVIRYMLRRPLDFEPGERYAYSNLGYSLLGRVIEKVTGMGYEDYVKKEVLAPLGIERMRLGKTLLKDRAPGEVKYYSDGKGVAVMGPNLGRPVPWPYGGWCIESFDSFGAWIASTDDLVRFASAFDHPDKCKILNADSIKTMFAPPPGEEKEKAYYACGWWVRRQKDGTLNTWHTGSFDGTSTLLVRRHDGLTWAVLFNSRNAAKGHEPSDAADSLMHEAADQVKNWPNGE